MLVINTSLATLLNDSSGRDANHFIAFSHVDNTGLFSARFAFFTASLKLFNVVNDRIISISSKRVIACIDRKSRFLKNAVAFAHELNSYFLYVIPNLSTQSRNSTKVLLSLMSGMTIKSTKILFVNCSGNDSKKVCTAPHDWTFFTRYLISRSSRVLLRKARDALVLISPNFDSSIPTHLSSSLGIGV
ncbi:MAG: hypothetical protein RBG13Loki_4175 [Promethearchaeota archaeon CR_4]|nr:MAG: hypothetical protein RBG13Loki_4175 [Candidatus Lokiarchaeota archaeon CR_4]